MDKNLNAQAASSAGPEREWFERLEQGKFEIQRCGACAKHVFYPRVICPHCGARELHWVGPSGRGTVYSATIIRNKPEDGGDYNLSLIDLDEGPRMMGRVVGVEPQEVRIGMVVAARVEKEGEKTLVVWESTS